MTLSLPLCHQCVCDCEGRRRTQPATQRAAGVKKSAANAKSAHEHLPRRPPSHRLASTWRTLFPHISSPDSVTHTHPECVVNARRVVDIRSAVHHIHSKEGQGGGSNTEKGRGTRASTVAPTARSPRHTPDMRYSTDGIAAGTHRTWQTALSPSASCQHPVDCRRRRGASRPERKA